MVVYLTILRVSTIMHNTSDKQMYLLNFTWDHTFITNKDNLK